MATERVCFAIGPDPFPIFIALVGCYTDHSANRWSDANRFEHMRRSQHIGCVGSQGVGVRPAYQGLGCQVKHYLRSEILHRFLKPGTIQDVAANVVDDACHGSYREQIGFCDRIKRIAAHLSAQSGQPESEPATFESSVTSKEDAPAAPGVHHFFHGALPLAQSSSNRCLSRTVSIGCQKPWWKNACTWSFAVNLCIGSLSNIQEWS